MSAFTGFEALLSSELDSIVQDYAGGAVDSEVLDSLRFTQILTEVVALEAVFLAKCFVHANIEAILRRRQQRREELEDAKKFTGKITLVVLGVEGLDVIVPDGCQTGGVFCTISQGDWKQSTTRCTTAELYWDQTFDMIVHCPTLPILVTVNHNITQSTGNNVDVVIGEAHVALSTLEGCRLRKRWYPLAARSWVDSNKKMFEHKGLVYGSPQLEGTEVLPGETTAGSIQMKIQMTYSDNLMVHIEGGGAPDERPCVAVIGAGGKVGKRVVQALLDSSWLEPASVRASTRTLEKLNKEAAAVSREVRGKIKNDALVMSCVRGVSIAHQADLLGVDNVLKLQVPEASEISSSIPTSPPPPPPKIEQRTSNPHILQQQHMLQQQQQQRDSKEVWSEAPALVKSLIAANDDQVREVMDVMLVPLRMIGCPGSSGGATGTAPKPDPQGLPDVVAAAAVINAMVGGTPTRPFIIGANGREIHHEGKHVGPSRRELELISGHLMESLKPLTRISTGALLPKAQALGAQEITRKKERRFSGSEMIRMSSSGPAGGGSHLM